MTFSFRQEGISQTSKNLHKKTLIHLLSKMKIKGHKFIFHSWKIKTKTQEIKDHHRTGFDKIKVNVTTTAVGQFLRIQQLVTCSIAKFKTAWVIVINFGTANTKSERKLVRDSMGKFSWHVMYQKINMMIIRELLLKFWSKQIMMMKMMMTKTSRHRSSWTYTKNSVSIKAFVMDYLF